MKKALSLLFASMMLLSFVACRGGDTAPSTPEASTPVVDTNEGGENDDDVVAAGDYKIGIVTGTVSQGEEEFVAAQNMIAQYGADMISHVTYPDQFDKEVETTISRVVSLADDEAVKAIVFVQAVPGASAAIDKVRESRPDMLFIAGVAAEAPQVIASKADMVMLVDEIGMGTTIPTQAKEMGAETFIHYSFARHMSYATISARHAIMKATCEELGIDFVDVTAPDPTSDAGAAGAQQFILENVPEQVEKYGKDTAFFSTNCSMQEPLIYSILQEGAIFPQQCCPSPYHGYPGALNLDVPEEEAGNVQFMLDAISEKVTEGGNNGRMSTWKLPINMLMIDAGVRYAIEYCEGNVGSHDDAVFTKIINEVAAEYNSDCVISYYSYVKGEEELSEEELALLEGDVEFEDGVEDGAEVEIPNFYMLLCDFYNF